MGSTKATRETFAKMSFAKIYPMYLQKVEKKGRTQEELHQVMTWLTGFDSEKIQDLIASDASFEDVFV